MKSFCGDQEPVEQAQMRAGLRASKNEQGLIRIGDKDLFGARFSGFRPGALAREDALPRGNLLNPRRPVRGASDADAVTGGRDIGCQSAIA